MFIDFKTAFDKFSIYKQEYNYYRSQPYYNYPISKTIFTKSTYNLQYFKGKTSNNIFLVVPSIINDASILTIGKHESFISFLTRYGDVYLINWNELENLGQDKQLDLSAYSLEVRSLLLTLNRNLGKKINLVGYCLGGTFAIAATASTSDIINNLLLLAAPWDFTYLQPLRYMQKILEFDKAIENLPFIPATYLQILFFLMDMEKSFKKFFNHTQINNVKEAQKFFDIERWLYTGQNVSKKAYKQLMVEFIEQNVTINNEWIVGDNIINPKYIKVPVLSVLGLKDKIVTSAAVRAIYPNLDNYNSIELNTGHIGFFVGHQKEKLFTKIDQWLGYINE